MSSTPKVSQPQLAITSVPHEGAGNCCACGLPLPARAPYGIIFTGSADAPTVLYTSHYDPPVTSELQPGDDEDAPPSRPCFDHLQVTHRELLEAE